MNHKTKLTEIIASEIVSSNMKQSQKTFDEVVDSMNLNILASKICEYHELDISSGDIYVCILGGRGSGGRDESDVERVVRDVVVWYAYP